MVIARRREVMDLEIVVPFVDAPKAIFCNLLKNLRYLQPPEDPGATAFEIAQPFDESRLLGDEPMNGAAIRWCRVQWRSRFEGGANGRTRVDSGDQTSGERFVRSVDARHQFRIASAAINAIPVHQLPSYALTRSVLELQRLMSEALMQLDAAFTEVGAHGSLVQYKDFASAFNDLAAREDDPVTKLVDAARSV